MMMSAAPTGAGAELVSIPITVRETAGLRRFIFPVVAAVPFPRGALADTRRVRLVDEQGREVGSQVTATARWPEDQSIQWLEVDFNASPAPNATLRYVLQVDSPVERSRATRGVMLTETEAAFQAGAFRVPKQGVPLLASVRYGELEYLRSEGAELTIVDRSGASRRPRPDSVRTRALKAEPICVMLEQRGEYAGGSGPLAFRTTMEFPSSKSWIRLVHEVEDPRGEVAEVALRLPFALETEPRLFDFGVGSWLYGALRPEQAATLTQRARGDGNGGATGWSVDLGGAADATRYATGSNRAEGWAHVMDAKKAIALGVAGAVAEEYTLRLAHDGDCVIRWRPERDARGASARRRRVEAYFHFIPFPPQLTAATSPPSMLAPLVARCAPERYRAAGVAPP
jgi:hypothetical protein